MLTWLENFVNQLLYETQFYLAPVSENCNNFRYTEYHCNDVGYRLSIKHRFHMLL